MKLITRAEWNARPPKDPGKVIIVNHRLRVGFMVHYSGESADQSVRSIQDWCMDHWGYNDIDYNVLADHNGNVYDGRGWDIVGAHCTGQNERQIGACLIGKNDQITDAGKAALRRLYDEACRVTGKVLEMHWHSQSFNTDCPGSVLREWVAAGMPYPDGYGPDAPPSTSFPKWPRMVFKYQPGKMIIHNSYVRQWQQQMSKRGWTIDADGWYGPQSRSVALKFQAEKHLVVDGEVGEKTWNAAWTAPIT